MSKYNEAIKGIITDVETFLTEGLKSVSLSKTASKEKDCILEKLAAFRSEYQIFSNQTKDSSDSGNSFSSLNVTEVKDGDPAYNDVITKVSASDAEDACNMKGFLSKKRKSGELISRLNPYQRRWCIIKNALFYYYDKPADKAQKGSFSLTGYEFREDSKKDNSFILYRLGDRTYEFLASTHEEMLEWKSAVEKASLEQSADPSRPSNQTVVEEDDDVYQPVDEVVKEVHGTSDVVDDEFYDDVGVEPAQIPARRALPPEPKIIYPDYTNWKIGVSNDYGNMYYGKWDCTSEATNELGFKQGDIIHVLSKEFDSKSWWIGELDGKIGLVPKQFLTDAYERAIG